MIIEPITLQEDFQPQEEDAYVLWEELGQWEVVETEVPE